MGVVPNWKEGKRKDKKQKPKKEGDEKNLQTKKLNKGREHQNGGEASSLNKQGVSKRIGGGLGGLVYPGRR